MTVFNALCHRTPSWIKEKQNKNFSTSAITLNSPEFSAKTRLKSGNIYPFSAPSRGGGNWWLFRLLLSKRQGTVWTCCGLIAGLSYKDEQPFTPNVSPQTRREHTNPTQKIPLAPRDQDLLVVCANHCLPKQYSDYKCTIKTFWETNIYLWHMLLTWGEKSKWGIDLWPSQRCHYIPCKNHNLVTLNTKVLILSLWQKWACHKPLKAHLSGAKGKN